MSINYRLTSKEAMLYAWAEKQRNMSTTDKEIVEFVKKMMEKEIQSMPNTYKMPKFVEVQPPPPYTKFSAVDQNGYLYYGWPIENCPGVPNVDNSAMYQQLIKAKNTIIEMEGVLNRIQKEPLVFQRIERLSKDRKYAYVKKGETELRIEACKNLMVGDEVLLHPKTYQIVEHIGRPPLNISPFSPTNIPSVIWDDIGGLESAKADMIEAIEFPAANKELFAFYNKKPIKGILLAGPPGCGKTLLGKAAANAIARVNKKESVKSGFLYIKGPEILNQYVGQTEQTIRDIFFDAQRHYEEFKYPAIIFIDEADAILAARGSVNVGIGNTIVPMFLTEMDGLETSNAIVIIATNRPDVLDPAIVRDGRIDRKITVTRPNQKNGEIILALNLKNIPLADGLTVEELSQEMAASIYSEHRLLNEDTPFSSVVNGAMLANCVQMAVSLAVRRDISNGTRSGVCFDDCIIAIDRIHSQSRVVKHDIEVEITIGMSDRRNK